jgi:hypothetical protein
MGQQPWVWSASVAAAYFANRFNDPTFNNPNFPNGQMIPSYPPCYTSLLSILTGPQAGASFSVQAPTPGQTQADANNKAWTIGQKFTSGNV